MEPVLTHISHTIIRLPNHKLIQKHQLRFLQLPPIDIFKMQHFKDLEPDFSLVGLLSEFFLVTFQDLLDGVIYLVTQVYISFLVDPPFS